LWLDTQWRIPYSQSPKKEILINSTDEVLRRQAPLCDGISGYNREQYRWSLDNSVEIPKGWIVRCKTVGELGEKTGLDKANVEETIRKYDEHCQ